MPFYMFWMIPMLKTLIGMDYQRGLTMLKALIETGTIPSKTITHGIQSVPAVRMAGVEGSCSVHEVGAYMEKAFLRADEQFSKFGLAKKGPMISVYTRFGMKNAVFDTICGFVVDDQVNVPSDSELKVWSHPAGTAFRVEHVGNYRHLGNGWSIANQLVRHQKLKQQRIGTYEIYRTTPAEVPEQECRTDIYLPLK
jgi:effector-binding domain-containing protein